MRVVRSSPLAERICRVEEEGVNKRQPRAGVKKISSPYPYPGRSRAKIPPGGQER